VKDKKIVCEMSAGQPAFPLTSGRGEGKGIAKPLFFTIRRAVGVLLLLLFLLLSSSSPLEAHPVPKSEIYRKITAEVKPTYVDIRYRLELAELELVKRVSTDEGIPLPKGVMTRKDFGDAYLKRMREIIPDGVLVILNKKTLKVKVVKDKVEFLDSAQFSFDLRVELPHVEGENRLEIEEINFVTEKGFLSLKVDVDSALPLKEIDEPKERPEGVGPDGSRFTATMIYTAKGAAKIDTPAPPETPIEQPVTPEEAPPNDVAGLLAQLRKDGLKALFGSSLGIGVLLLVSFLHGAMHSLAPGHGKTMVAAYLIGEKGKPRHAIVLGLIVTLAHTSSAVGIALLLRAIPNLSQENVQTTLEIIGGITIILVGFWLLMARLRGAVGGDHSHAHGHSHGGMSHSHSHGDGSNHSHGLTPREFARAGWARLILLGLAGGIVPCWGAILWVLYSIAANQFGLALWTVLSFSVGLASVLIVIGLSLVWGKKALQKRVKSSSKMERIATTIGLVGAMFVIGVGVWLCVEALHR